MSSIFEGNGRDAVASGNGCVIKIEMGDKTRKLGSGLIDHNQKMTVAAIAIADMKV